MDLKDLYRDVIVDHNRSPRNFGALATANHCAEGHNPLCGDRLKLYVDVAGGKLEALAFEGSGCAISVASASLMTEALKGRELADVRDFYDQVHRLLTEHDYVPERDLGKLAALSGVREFPARVKCASLCWHTLVAALDSKRQPVSTE
ncbi:MAG TPA: SUF system NifU family Fe-S cluster assembly protein [Steroidobacteraceae bacterium]|nr:SUF system NifU family Fe-S cluster assembly protein [Steroidobacteraceae bacterium]